MAFPETESRHAATAQKVCAIVVSFFPDIATLGKLITAIMPQVNALAIIDNGTSDAAFDRFCREVERDNIVILKQHRNIGLAAAFNRGIAWAREQGFSHILLLDQDSEPEQGMVSTLMQALADKSAGRKVAAVGPRFHDVREDRYAPFVRIGFPVNRKIYDTGTDGLIDSDFLISSGSLIPMTVLDDIGTMDEGLFIDNVDLEWGFRARSKGYALVGVCATTMPHRLGHGRWRLPVDMGQIVVHDPIRLYYIMRNRLLLYRLPHTPAIWIAQDMLRIPFKFLLFSVLIPPRRRHIRFILAGLRDGLLGRTGPFVEKSKCRPVHPRKRSKGF